MKILKSIILCFNALFFVRDSQEVIDEVQIYIDTKIEDNDEIIRDQKI